MKVKESHSKTSLLLLALVKSKIHTLKHEKHNREASRSISSKRLIHQVHQLFCHQLCWIEILWGGGGGFSGSVVSMIASHLECW